MLRAVVPILVQNGTFVPSLLFGGAASGMTYGTRLGAYTRIGRVVTFEIVITLTAKGASAGTATISGLPFTSIASIVAPVLFVAASNCASLTVPGCWITASSQVIELRQQSAGISSVVMNDTNFTATSSFTLGGSYLAV